MSRNQTSVAELQPLAVTIQQAAAMLGMCTRTLQREIQRGRFPAPVKFGPKKQSRCRILIADIHAFLASLRSSDARKPYQTFSGGNHLDHQVHKLIDRVQSGASKESFGQLPLVTPADAESYRDFEKRLQDMDAKRESFGDPASSHSP